MSQTGQKSVIQIEIEKNIRPGLDKVQKDHDQQLPELRALIDQLTKAIDKKDAAVLQKLRPTFDGHVKFASELVVRASKLGGALGKLAAKTPDDQKAVKEIAAKLTKLEQVLQKNLLNLKGGQDKVQDAYDKASGVANRYVEEWARMEDLLNQYLANGQWRLKQATGFVEKAKAAVADRDRKKLLEWTASAAKFRAGTPSNIEVSKAWKQFNSKPIAGGIDENAVDQFKRDLPKLKQVFDAGVALEAPIGALHLELSGLSIAAVDKKKAVALLKVPAPEVQTFTDALGLPISSMEKFLNDVGKTLKPPRTGKQIIAELRKAKLL